MAHFTEAAAGGPIGLIEEGDIISIDMNNNTLNVEVDEATLAKRRESFKPILKEVPNGYLKRYRQLVTSANTGAVFMD